MKSDSTAKQPFTNSQPSPQPKPELVTDMNGLLMLFPLEAYASDPAARFQILVDLHQAFKNEAALEASIMSSPAARKYLADYLGYDLGTIKNQKPVLPGTRLAADIVATCDQSNSITTVFELTHVPIDTDHVHRSISYAKLLGARDVVLIAPAFPSGVMTLVRELQRKDKDGITLHMIRVIAFHLHGERDYHFSFQPLTAPTAQSQTITALEDIIRRAHALGDNSLNIDSILVDDNGRVRVPLFQLAGCRLSEDSLDS